MFNPKVSIIIPVYNRALLISEMLDSIIAQTCEDWECIIVDDGSTDNTETVIRSYSDIDGRFQYYKRPDSHKRGGNGARNYGFLVSNGEYVNFVDSDDILHRDFVKEKLFAIKKSQADVVISKTILTTMNINDVERFEKRTKLSDNLLEDFITLKISWYVHDPIWKRALLEGKKIFDEDLLKWQDRDFHIRMLMEKPKMEILDKHLYYYRRNPNSISASFSEKVAYSIFKVGLIRNNLLLEANISRETEYFLLKQQLSLYTYLYKKEGVLKEYSNLIPDCFKWDFKFIVLISRFLIAVFSFNLLGKGERILK